MNRRDDLDTTYDGISFLLLDACCAINLLASAEARAILDAMEGMDVAVAELVAQSEVLRVPSSSEEESADQDADPEPTETTLTLAPLIDEGLLSVLSPRGDQEAATYVDLALRLDEGEAMTGALAIHRGGAVATDDKKAIRVLGEQTPAPEIRRTSWLVRSWANAADIDEERLCSALRNIERRGSFFPPTDDPLLDWWRRMTGRTSSSR